MIRRSSLLALLFASACFAEPSFGSSATGEGSSSRGTTTNEPEITLGSNSTGPLGSSSGPPSSGSSSSSECLVGSLGCPCDEGDCESGAVCIEGFCELTIPEACGDGVLVPPERCDDGNNDPGDGCSATCEFEGECFVAHLGGPDRTSVVRAYTVFPDGTMLERGGIDVPGHNPPESGAGSQLSHAAVSCRGLVYVASSSPGVITGLQFTTDGLTEADTVGIPAVRELACDSELGLLFATQFVSGGFAVSTFDISNDTLEPDATAAHDAGAGLEMRAARLSLDRESKRALVSFVLDNALSAPLQFVAASYGQGSLRFSTSSPLGVVRSQLGALQHVAAIDEVLGIGAGTGDQSPPVVYHLEITDDGAGNFSIQQGPPWADRRNIWPLRLSGGEIGFALGGAEGVVLAHYPERDNIEMIGEPVATTLSNTFARTAFDDGLLIVASPDGFETYDLTQDKDPWPMLSELPLSASQTFVSGVVVPCP